MTTAPSFERPERVHFDIDGDGKVSRARPVVKMEPETIARRAQHRAAERQAAKDIRVERLRQLTAQHGPDSIWAELLDIEMELEHEATETQAA